MMQAVLMYKSLINLHDSGSYTHTHTPRGGEVRERREREARNKGREGEGGGEEKEEEEGEKEKTGHKRLVLNSLQLRSGLSFYSKAHRSTKAWL